MEIAREADLLRLGGAEGGDAGELERQPQPERAEMAGQLGRKVGRRRADAALAERPDIIGARAERVEQLPPVARDDGAGAVGQEQGLVRIERDGVGALDPAQVCRAPPGTA